MSERVDMAEENVSRRPRAPAGMLPLRVNDHTPSTIICANGGRISVSWREQQANMASGNEYERAEQAAAFIVASCNAAEENVADLKAENERLREALKLFAERIEQNGEWDDGCFYYRGTSASELQEPLRTARATLSQEPRNG